ncbi:hypothetical protein, partial [Shewanella aestuarii]
CLHKKDGCDLKFDVKRWSFMGSAKSMKLTIDAIVSCYMAVYRIKMMRLFVMIQALQYQLDK